MAGEGEFEMAYEKPTVVDHGDLNKLTAATTIIGEEDGASKIDTDNHHSL
jgi:hypothetical protein